MNRAELVALARYYDGVTARDPRYVELLRHPGDDARHGAGWAARYYEDPRTSTCALTVLGLWRLAGVRSQLLQDAYRPGYATADMGSIARGAVAYHDVTDLLSGRYSPRPGDAVMIVQTDGRREHAFTLVDVVETEIGWRVETIDGGLVDKSREPWVLGIRSVKRVWRRGPGRIVDDVDGRLVAYVVDAKALLAASGPDTEPAPAPESIPEAAPTDPAPYVLGVDVSYCQDPDDIDWPVLAKTHRFAIIKAGEATSRDPRLLEHVDAARTHVRTLGLYFVPHQDPPAQAQVDVFRKAMAAAGMMDGPGHLLPVLDLEGTSGRTPEKYTARVREIAELLGEVMIYLSPSFYLWMGEPLWMRDYPWWVAHYTDKPAPWCPWVEWAIWQHRVKPLNGYHGTDPKTGAPLPIDQNRARRLPIRTEDGTGYL